MATHATPSIRHFTLPPAEVMRALEAGGPLKDLPVEADRLKDMTVAAVEFDGEIVAYWVIWYALHVEPLWVRPEFRKHPAVIRGIVAEMQRVVEATGEPAAFCVIEAENLAEVAPYANRLNFSEAPGKLFYVVVQPPDPPKKEI
jgi:hypothetical protein